MLPPIYFSTKTFAAISCPSATFEPRTHTSIGPFNGATLSTFMGVPGVRPMSKSLWRTLCSPLMKEIFAMVSALRLHIEIKFCWRLPTSSKPFLCKPMHSSHVVKGRSQAGMILPSSGQVSGCFRKRHNDSSASSDSACSILQASTCTLSLPMCKISERNLSSNRCFLVTFCASWSPFSVKVLPW